MRRVLSAAVGWLRTRVRGLAGFGRLYVTAVLVLLAGYLWFLWERRDNGRYVFCAQPEAMVMDTRTGSLYLLPSEGDAISIEFRPQTGEVVRHYRWERAKAAAARKE